jgi:hypothetical protein
MNTLAIRELTLQSKGGSADAISEVFLAEHLGCTRWFRGTRDYSSATGWAFAEGLSPDRISHWPVAAGVIEIAPVFL